MKLLTTAFLTFFFVQAFSQNIAQRQQDTVNFGFETLAANGVMPYRWAKFNAANSYKRESSTAEKHSGSRSLLISQSDSTDKGYAVVTHVVSGQYQGKEVEFRVYLKSENVKKFASIMLRIDGAYGKLLANNTLQLQGTKGTTDWKQYAVKADLPAGARSIYIGIILNSGGKLWADDAQVLFDGIDVGKAAINPDYQPDSKAAPSFGNNAAAAGLVKLKNAALYYETYGKGQPLLLLHGNSQSIGAFNGQIADLAKKYKVIAVDTRGQGKSIDETTGPLSYDLFADDMRQLLDSLRIKKADILGWSDGGNTGLIMAIKYPEHVNKLAITGANLFPTKAAVVDSVFTEVTSLIKQNQAQTDEHSKMQVRLFTMILNEPHLSFDDLKAIKCPVLVMAGEHDLILEKHTRAIAAAIPKSQLVIFKGASHFVPRDEPKVFNKAVIDFFK